MVKRKFRYAEALLDYFVIAAGAGYCRFGLRRLWPANLLMAHSASLHNWLGVKDFCVSPTNRTFSRGLGGYESTLLVSVFAERSFRYYSYEPASSVPFTFTGNERPP
jgi:hypothetical protein